MKTRAGEGHTRGLCEVECENHVNRTEDLDRSLKCDICSKQFSRKDALAAHLFRHTGKRPYSCKQCSQSFSMKSYLDRHMVSHSGHKQFSCDVCGKIFSYRSGLNAHKLLHSGEVSTFPCSQCKKVLRSKGTYNQHMLLHSNHDSHVKCSVCGKQYTCRAYLNKHMHTHKGTKRYHCEHCKKGFLIKQSYDEHMVRHNGIKPVQCETCGRRYFTSRELKKHLVFHTKVTNHHCDSCKMYFSTSSSLMKHNIKSHPKLYSCNRCAESFTDKKKLVSHKYHQHDESVASTQAELRQSSIGRETCHEDGDDVLIIPLAEKDNVRKDDIECGSQNSEFSDTSLPKTQISGTAFPADVSGELQVNGNKLKRADSKHQCSLTAEDHHVNAETAHAESDNEHSVDLFTEDTSPPEFTDSRGGCAATSDRTTLLESEENNVESFHGNQSRPVSSSSCSNGRPVVENVIGRLQGGSLTTCLANGPSSPFESNTLDKVDHLEQDLEEFPSLDFDDLREEIALDKGIEHDVDDLDADLNAGEGDINGENTNIPSHFSHFTAARFEHLQGVGFTDNGRHIAPMDIVKDLNDKEAGDPDVDDEPECLQDGIKAAGRQDKNIDIYSVHNSEVANAVQACRHHVEHNAQSGDFDQFTSNESSTKDIVQQSIEEHFNERFLPGSDVLIFVDDDGSVVGYQSQSEGSTAYQSQPEGSAAYQSQPEGSSASQSQPEVSTGYQSQPTLAVEKVDKHSNVRERSISMQTPVGNGITIINPSHNSQSFKSIIDPANTKDKLQSMPYGAKTYHSDAAGLATVQSLNNQALRSNVNSSQKRRVSFTKIAPKIGHCLFTGTHVQSTTTQSEQMSKINNQSIVLSSSSSSTSSFTVAKKAADKFIQILPAPSTSGVGARVLGETITVRKQPTVIGPPAVTTSNGPLRSLLDRSHLSGPTIIPKQPRNQHQQQDKREYKYEIVIENLGEANEKISKPREIKKPDAGIVSQSSAVDDSTKGEVSLDSCLPRSDSRAEFVRFENVLKAKLCRMESFGELDGFLERMETSFRSFRAGRQHKRLESKHKS